MIERIDHIELVVRDVNTFVEFFQKMGFQLLTRTPHHGGSAELQLPGPHQPIFEIHQVNGEENVGVNHIAFLTDDIQKSCDELKVSGIPFEAGPRLIKVSGRIVANFRDPDGWRLQLVDPKRVDPQAETT